MRAIDLSPIEQKVHALSPRERIIMLVLFVTVVLGGYDSLYFSGAVREYRRLSAHATDLGRTVASIGEQMAPLSAELAVDNDKSLRDDIVRLSAEKARLDQEIEAASSNLVNAHSMNDVLAVLVREHPGVSLNTLTSLPVKAVNLGTEEAPMMLYEHALQVSVSGNFPAIERYLRDIEEKETRLEWDEMAFSRSDTLVGRVRFVVKTLGRDKEFLQVNGK